MNYALKDRYVYNPNTKYYFISVMRVVDAAWIRRGYQTEDEVQEFIHDYAARPGTYRNLQIFDEELLLEHIGIESDGKYIDVNLRGWIFDARYSASSDLYKRIRSGEREMSWKDGYKEWKAGELSQSTSEV
jgi:hypothetical protein